MNLDIALLRLPFRGSVGRELKIEFERSQGGFVAAQRTKETFSILVEQVGRVMKEALKLAQPSPKKVQNSVEARVQQPFPKSQKQVQTTYA